MTLVTGEPRCVVAQGDWCGEGATWSADEGAIYWTDINRFLIHRHHLQDGATRSWVFDEPVVALSLTDDPDCMLVALGSKLIFWKPENDERRDQGFALEGFPEVRFNDGRSDPHGTFWIGSMGNNVGADGEVLARLPGAVHQQDDGRVDPVEGAVFGAVADLAAPDRAAPDGAPEVPHELLRVVAGVQDPVVGAEELVALVLRDLAEAVVHVGDDALHVRDGDDAGLVDRVLQVGELDVRLREARVGALELAVRGLELADRRFASVSVFVARHAPIHPVEARFVPRVARPGGHRDGYFKRTYSPKPTVSRPQAKYPSRQRRTRSRKAAAWVSPGLARRKRSTARVPMPSWWSISSTLLATT